MTPYFANEHATLYHAEALPALQAMATASIDAVICDPPYPCIRRSYGYWTEAEWFAMVNPVVEECRRVLKPTGSAVFVLQPNSERVGRMRPWLWEFMAKWTRDWGMVQDAYWWNTVTLPVGGATTAGLLRSSLKHAVWLGSEDCYRDQISVLWGQGEYHRTEQAVARSGVERPPSGQRIDVKKCLAAAIRRGGVTPYNVMPLPNNRAGKGDDAGSHGHGAGTPAALCRWWTRYLCPPGGVTCDPFGGSGTVALAAIAEGRKTVYVERDAGYVEIAAKRVAEASAKEPVDLFAGAPV